MRRRSQQALVLAIGYWAEARLWESYNRITTIHKRFNERKTPAQPAERRARAHLPATSVLSPTYRRVKGQPQIITG